MHKGRLLAIVAHPDDEIFGCGGTIALHVEQGHPVSILSLTCSAKIRRLEMQEAAEVLGVKDLRVFDEIELPDNMQVIRLISDIIVSKQPDIIVTHLPFDYHSEHRVTLKLVKEAIEWAAHTTMFKKPWKVDRLLLMEVNTLIPSPHVLVDISEMFEKKMEAIQLYKSQIQKFPEDYYQRFSSAKAKLRGVQGGCEYAEAFIEEPLKKNSPFYEQKSTQSLFKTFM